MVLGESLSLNAYMIEFFIQNMILTCIYITNSLKLAFKIKFLYNKYIKDLVLACRKFKKVDIKAYVKQRNLLIINHDMQVKKKEERDKFIINVYRLKKGNTGVC